MLKYTANLLPKTNALFLFKVFKHTDLNINGKRRHTLFSFFFARSDLATVTHTLPPFYLISDLLGLDFWHLHTPDQTNTHIDVHTNKIKHTPNRQRTGERCGAGGREDSKRLTQSGRRGLKTDRKSGHGRSEEHRGEDEKMR